MFDSYADIFAQRGKAYHSAMRRWPEARRAEFEAMVGPLGEAATGTLCDMPSGGAYLAPHLPPALHYVGVEPAEDFFCEWPDGAERINADIKQVPLADGSVDHVVSLAGLHHEPDLGAVFREFRRLVRPGGRLVIADVAVGTGPAVFLNGFVDRANPMGHNGRFLDSEFPGLLEREGIEPVEDVLVEVPWRFSSRAEAALFGRELFWLERAGPDEVEEALAADVGFRENGSGVELLWVLRRLVCRC